MEWNGNLVFVTSGRATKHTQWVWGLDINSVRRQSSFHTPNGWDFFRYDRIRWFQYCNTRCHHIMVQHGEMIFKLLPEYGWVNNSKWIIYLLDFAFFFFCPWNIQKQITKLSKVFLTRNYLQVSSHFISYQMNLNCSLGTSKFTISHWLKSITSVPDLFNSSVKWWAAKTNEDQSWQKWRSVIK